jgi:hypothetical protein
MKEAKKTIETGRLKMIDASMKSGTRKERRRLWRKSLLVPAEHGSWSWFLVPFVAGVGVAGIVDAISAPAVLLALVGGLSAFLMRQPATAWLRIRQGRGRRSDQPLAAGWTSGLALLSLLCLLGLLLLGRTTLLWLLLPLSAIFCLYLTVAQINRARTRSLWMEMAGAAGLAAMAPAAFTAATGRLDPTAWHLWTLMAAQNLLGVLYVRLRLADTRARTMSRPLVLAGHLLGLLVASLVIRWGNVPALTMVPFAAFLLRAIWAVARARPVPDVRRFGFTEVGLEVSAGLWFIISYLAG